MEFYIQLTIVLFPNYITVLYYKHHSGRKQGHWHVQDCTMKEQKNTFQTVNTVCTLFMSSENCTKTFLGGYENDTRGKEKTHDTNVQTNQIVYFKETH